MKQILKIQYQIFILIKKVIILSKNKKKRQRRLFRSTILQPFQFEPEQKITFGNESHQKETKHSHASAFITYWNSI